MRQYPILHPKGFNPKFCEVESLKKRLRKEENRVTELQSENDILRGSYALLEHERNVYSSLIRRMRSEVRGALQQIETQNVTDASHPQPSEDHLYTTAQIMLREANAILSNYHITSTLEVDSSDEEDSMMDLEEDNEGGEALERGWDTDVDVSMSIDAQNGADERNHGVRSYRTVSISTDDL